MLTFLKRHRLALGYVLVALVSTAAALTALELLPRFTEWLGARGYEMQSPEYLWLVLAIPLLWFVRLHSLTDLPIVQQLVSATLRSAMILALALALTQITHISHESRKVATVMVVDVSESVPDEVLAEAQRQLQALHDERGESLVRLVTFAESPQVIQVRADEQGRVAPIERHAEGTLGTDLQQAMRLAYGLYPPGYLKRMVVVTDGNETEGNALAEVETAVRLGVRVHHRTYPDIESRKELMVAALNVPDEIEQNVPFPVSVQLSANYEHPAKCTLKVDDLVAGAETFDLVKGEQTVSFDEVRVREGGEHAFTVECAPEGENVAALDGFDTNNRFSVTRKVPEKKRLLYVEGEALYSDNFRDALADDFEVEVRGQQGIPSTLTEAKKYKAIVVSDVPRMGAFYRQNMSSGQMRMLHDYARQGGMLLFTGGDSSLGPGGYGDTYLERRVLPVRLDVEHELETPRLALMLVLDKSGSMSGEKLELAKKAARETVKALDKRDLVGIIAFDAGPQKLIRLTRATSKTRFDRALSRLRAGGGTGIYEGLAAAVSELEGVDAQIKHIILMTDGQANKLGMFNPAEDAAKKKITVSTIAVGAQSDRALLRSLADIGRGRYYYTENAEAIPKLFVDETREVAGESIREEPTRAVLNRRFAGLRWLKGVDVRRAPALGGYVPTQAKREAEVIMTVGEGDPLLARWKQGKGWVYVFTSDIKNKWGRSWLRWSGFAPLWRQLIKDGLEEEEEERRFPIEVAAARHKLRVATDALDEDDRFISGVQSRATITDPDGETRQVTLTQAAPGRYEVEVEAAKYGPYQIDVVHEKDGEKLAVSQARIAYPYPEEHLRFDPDLARVQSLSENTGGGADPTPQALLDVQGEQLTHRAPAWHWLLYFALAALFLDVLLRRVRFWPARTTRLGAR